MYWIFQFNIFGIFLELKVYACMTLLDISIQYFCFFFFELKVYACMTGLDIILRFEKCSLNVHNRLRFSIKKNIMFCTVVDVVKS